MTLKVGVVGMGFMGELHAKIYKSLKDVQLVGVVEVDKSRHKELESQFHIKVYDRIEDLLPHVDAVSVCTPDHLHKEAILKAFRSRVKVLVEKPLSTTLQDSQEILDHRPDSSFLMVGHILRFDPRIIHCKEVLDSGKLGRIWNFKIWRHNSLESGFKIGNRTSVTWYLGIHDIELMLYLTNLKIKKVSAVGQKWYTPNWDYVHAHLHLEEGVFATMENSWIMPVQRSSGLDAGIKIICEKGMIEVNLFHSDVTVSSTNEGRQKSLDTYHWPMEQQVPQGDLRKELQTFVAAVISGSIPPVTGEQALEAVKAIEWIEKSLETGQQQRI